MRSWLPGNRGNRAPPRAEVEIYTWWTCPHCVLAKTLLRWKGVDYTEYRIDGDDQARAAMARRAGGRRTVPQIFINGEPVGGRDRLFSLQLRGRLDAMLAQPANRG